MRIAASVAVTVLVSTALSGCMLFTPQQTSRSYTPSDGVNGQVGDVRIRNVFLVSTDGQTANMIGALSNIAGEARTVTVQYATSGGDETATVRLPARGTVLLDPSGNRATDAAARVTNQELRLDGIDTELGALYEVGFETADAQPVTLRVPVLTGSLIDYATLTPTPSPSPTRSRRTPTPSPSASDDSSGSINQETPNPGSSEDAETLDPQN